jgi:DDE superfamily endonuclease/Helix-turn-helix of DDE superfamily endonuclease
MVTYSELQSNRRQFLALTGLTVPEFQTLLPAFTRSYRRLHPPEKTMAGQPRQRPPGGGRRGALPGAEQKLLFILVYLKAYPLQALMGELFGLSQPRVNAWIHRLLPVLQQALAEAGALPERDPGHFAQAQPSCPQEPELIIDGTDRRRQRPKNPEKQAAHYTGKKKAHTDKNVAVVDAPSKRVGFLSQTYAGRTHDKRIADQEGISYPPGTVLYKDTGFQGYEPAGTQTRQAKKKATPRGVDGRGKAHQPEAGTDPGPGGACPRRREALAHRQRRLAEH